jgi:RHS repeat-associated protein
MPRKARPEFPGAVYHLICRDSKTDPYFPHQFTYDGLGRCVRRTINGAVTLIAYDGWKPTVEWDGAGNLQAWNVYGAGPDEILWRYQGVDHLRYHHDSHGNVIYVLGSSGQGLERYTYDAFGQPTITDWGGNVRATSAVGNRFMFQGREYLSELGIYDYRHRFYHPGIGRFIQADPIGFDAGDMNLFRYCGDDPVDGSDPTGLHESASVWNRQMWLQGGSVAAFAVFDGLRQGAGRLEWSVSVQGGGASEVGKGESGSGGGRAQNAASHIDNALRRFNIPGALDALEGAKERYATQFPNYPSADPVIAALRSALADGRIRAGLPSDFHHGNPMITRNRVILVDPRSRLLESRVPSLLAHEGQHLTDRDFSSPFGRERRAFDVQYGFGNVLGSSDRPKTDADIHKEYGY